MSLLNDLQTHSSQPSPFTPRPLILVQRARALGLNSEIQRLTRAVEQNVLLVKRSLPSLPQSPRSDSQIAYLRNGSPLIAQNHSRSSVTPLPTPPMTPENRRTLNPLHTRASSHRRIYLRTASPASPLSTDITDSLLFANDAPLLSADPPPLVDHAPGSPVSPSDVSAGRSSYQLSEATSGVWENGGAARWKAAHASSIPFLAVEDDQQGETVAPRDIPSSESSCQHQQKVPQLPLQIHGSASVPNLTISTTAQQDGPTTKAIDAENKRSMSPPLRVDTRRPSVLFSTPFINTDTLSPYTYAPSLRGVRDPINRPPTPPLRPLKPLPLRPITRKPPPAIPIELLPQTPAGTSTVTFPSSASSPIPRTWSTSDSWSIPSSYTMHPTPSTMVVSKLEPVIEVPFLESRGRFPSFSSKKEPHSRQRRSISFEGVWRRQPVEFLGLNKSTPNLRLETRSTRDRVVKGRDSPRARILSLGLLCRPRTGSRPKLSISSPLSNPPATTDPPPRLNTICTSPTQESSPPTPSPTTSKRLSSSFRRWTNFVAKIFEPSSASRPSSPSTTPSSRSLPPPNTNPNIPPVSPFFGKLNKRRQPHGRSFSQGTDSPSRRSSDEANVSGFCWPAEVHPGRRPSLP